MIIQTLRSFRVGPFAVFDFASAYLGVYLLAPVLSYLCSLFGLSVTRTQWLWLTLPLSILFHLLFGSRTPFTVMVLDPSGHILAKLLVLGMLFMAFRK